MSHLYTKLVFHVIDLMWNYRRFAITCSILFFSDTGGGVSLTLPFAKFFVVIINFTEFLLLCNFFCFLDGSENIYFCGFITCFYICECKYLLITLYNTACIVSTHFNVPFTIILVFRPLYVMFLSSIPDFLFLLVLYYFIILWLF